jgi:predicted phosphodiesterase
LRIAIFSDLHGNPFACEALLEQLAREAPLDYLVAAGDLCLGGSNPRRVIELLRSAGVLGVYGNTEEYLKAPQQMPNDDLHRGMWAVVQPVALWTLEQLSQDQIEWLFSLPFDLRFPGTTRKADDLLVVHANPRDVELMIYPAAQEQMALLGEVRQADDDPALVHALQGVDASLVAFGHFHFPFQRRWRKVDLVGVASCSLPGYDHDPRAKYTLFTWQGQAWQVEQRFVSYAHEREISALRSSSMPNWEHFARYFAGS